MGQGGCRFSVRIVGLVVFVVPDTLLTVVDLVGCCVVVFVVPDTLLTVVDLVATTLDITPACS